MRDVHLKVIGLVMWVSVFATPALAVRTEYIALVNGERLAGSTVCFFSAKVDDGFFAKFLSSPDVRCLSADAIIDMPAGNWNSYVEHESPAYTSNHPTFQTGDFEDEADKRGYRSLDVNLVPAGTLRFREADLTGGRGAVYVHTANPALIRPASPGKRQIIVPSGQSVLPLRVDAGRISRIGRVAVVDRNRTADVVFDEVKEGRRHVLRLPSSVSESADAFEAPDIHLRLPDGRELRPLLPPRSGPEIDRSLVVFQGVPPGPAEIVLGGRFWKKSQISVPASQDAVQTLDQHLEAEPAGAAVIRWTAPRSTGVTTPCRIKDSEERRSTFQGVRLSRCDAQCVVIAETRAEGDEGRVDVGSLPAGTYRAELYHRLGTTTEDVTVALGQQAEVNLTLNGVAISGVVLHGDEPLPADLLFATGTATTDSSGRYVAMLPRSPGRESVVVVPCDGSAVYHSMPDRELGDLSTFDIRVPANEVSVAVINAVTARPVAGISASVAVLSERNGDEVFYLDAPPTNSDGIATLSRLTPDRWLRVCVHRGDFLPRCADDLRIDVDEKRQIELRLQPADRRPGRVVTEGEIGAGLLYWINAQGDTTEMVHVGSDGRFTYRMPHGTAEHLVFIARNRPLAAFRSEPAPGEILEIHLPRARIVRFTITPNVRSARIALEIGGLVVPESVFSRYQMIEGQAPSVNDSRPIVVRGVAQTGPIVVLAGPPTSFMPPGLPPETDLSSLPPYRVTYRRIPVTGPTVFIPAEH